MKRNGNAERRRRENRGAEEVGEGSGDFLSGNGAFWCILCACFNVSIRRVKQSRKAVLCANCQLVSYLIWRTYRVKLQLTIMEYKEKYNRNDVPVV